MASHASSQGSERSNARRAPREDTGRVVVVALAGWSALVSGAALEGVFARLEAAPCAALAIFALAYAMVAYVLDDGVRSWLERRSARTLAAVAVAIDVALAAGAWEALRAGDGWEQLLATLHGPVLALVVAPLAAPCHLGAVRVLLRARLSSGVARSPGATPAAT